MVVRAGPWKILEIDPTDDERAIRRAYSAKLKRTNPEDDAEGFQALREAFEAAMAEAQRRGEHAAAVAAQAAEGQAPDPRAEQIEAHWRASQALAARIEAGADPPELVAAFRAIALDPVMGMADVGPQARAWLMNLIARGEPASDPLVEPAIQIFGCERGDLRLDPTIRALQAEVDAHGAARQALAEAVQARSAESVLQDALRKVLSSPAMDNMRVRQDVEVWLAQLIVAQAPFADALATPCIEAFGWDLSAPAPGTLAADVLEREADSRFLAAIQRRANPLSSAWRALSSQSDRWLRLWWCFSRDLTRQVPVLLDLVDRQHPSLAERLNPESAAWWRARVAQPQVSPVMLMLIVATAGLALIGMMATPLPGGLTLLAAPSLLAAVSFGWVHGLARPRHAWRMDPDGRALWRRFGWAGVALASLGLLAASYLSGWTVVAAAGLGLVAAVWAWVTEAAGAPRPTNWLRWFALDAPIVLASIAANFEAKLKFAGILAIVGVAVALYRGGFGLSAFWRLEVEERRHAPVLVALGLAVACAPLASQALSSNPEGARAGLALVVTLYGAASVAAVDLSEGFAAWRARLLFASPLLLWLLASMGLAFAEPGERGFGGGAVAAFWLMAVAGVSTVGALRRRRLVSARALAPAR